MDLSARKTNDLIDRPIIVHGRIILPLMPAAAFGAGQCRYSNGLCDQQHVTKVQPVDQPGGVEHQHFNIKPGSECRWIAFSYMPFFDHVASEFTQTEVSPLFKAQQG